MSEFGGTGFLEEMNIEAAGWTNTPRTPSPKKRRKDYKIEVLIINLIIFRKLQVAKLQMKVFEQSFFMIFLMISKFVLF